MPRSRESSAAVLVPSCCCREGQHKRKNLLLYRCLGTRGVLFWVARDSYRDLCIGRWLVVHDASLGAGGVRAWDAVCKVALRDCVAILAPVGIVLPAEGEGACDWLDL